MVNEPKEGELVICTIKEISNSSAWCEIIEYPEYKALLDLIEQGLDSKEVKIGKQYVAKIVEIDKNKKIAKLSLKIKEIEKKQKWEEFKRERGARKFFELIAKKRKISLDELAEELNIKKYGSFYNFLINLEKEIDNLPKKYKEDFEEVLEKLKRKKEVEISYTIFAISFSKKLEEIKKILSILEKVGEVKYIGAGKYLLKKLSTNPKKDEKEIIQTLEKISKEFDVFKYKKNEKA